MSGQVAIRAARPDDVELIFGMIVALAEYERAPGHVVGTPALLHQALFGAAPAAEAVVAERAGGAGEQGGAGEHSGAREQSGARDQRGAGEREAVGFALFHGTFSTWECLPGLWLEDLYVPPEHRRGGVGEALLRHVARTAVERGCARLEWAALDWNVPALSFYEKLGASLMDEWKIHRLTGGALAAVGGAATGGA